MKLRRIAFLLLLFAVTVLSACNAHPADTTSIDTPSITTPTDTTPIETTPHSTTPTATPSAAPEVDSFYDPETGLIDLSKFNFQKEFSYERFYASNGIYMPYRLYIPPTYNDQEEFPLLVYLHGAGARSILNNKPLYEASIYLKNAESPAFHSIMLVPQCLEDAWWNENVIDAFVELLDHINATYSTDSSRQYITGASMGGDGVWQMLLNYPDRVSAAIPVASCGDAYISEDMLDIPIHMIYDDTDDVSPPTLIPPLYQQLVNGGNTYAKITKTSGHGHQICNRFVSATDISALEWLFDQRRETGTKRSADGISRFEQFYTYHEFTGSNGITLPYRLYSPGKTDMPLTLYLHSKATQGTDNARHLEEIDSWAPYTAEVHRSVVLVPQCPEGLEWTGDVIDTVVELIAFIEETYEIDTSRQHAVGNEMGAIGIWDLATRYPSLLESAVLCSGKTAPDTKIPEISYKISTLPSTMITCLLIDEYTASYYAPFFEGGEAEVPKNIYPYYFSRLWHLRPRQFNTWIYNVYMVSRNENGDAVYEWIPPT